ncbi:MAG: NAD(P)H-hydrate dehydratase [Leptolyngbyaceae cyanobacterium bins.302]|nr:NAD(P)H-hydrate dehydratase [Leptolyngbyaceae cyanobacterium bins.302]
MNTGDRAINIQQFVVTADQMRQIEGRVFAAGMPVAALMEKVAGRITQRVQALDCYQPALRVGVLVGPGHNGGDALVVARELHFSGCQVRIYQPFERLKDLTATHGAYCQSLGIPFSQDIATLQHCDLLIDGLFGFGLERLLEGTVAEAIAQLNQWTIPIVSIDLPSGLHTDTGEVLGTAIRATHTLCLGLWKQGLLQDPALAWSGQTELVEFDLPLTDIQAVVGEGMVRRITPAVALAHLPLTRSPTAYKYRVGHLLLVCGSRRYAGAALLAGLGARGSGVGMLSIAVPESVKPLFSDRLPEALIIGCPETESGAIADLPIEVEGYDAIGCGAGMTLEALPVIQQVLSSDRPLVLDADGLNALAQLGTVATLQARTATTVLTPHLGEFKRLFPELSVPMNCRITATRTAAQQTGAIVLLKGARTTIADAQTVWINPDSSSALARGGSGDVLTGLTSGLLAQAIASEQAVTTLEVVKSAAWWHSQAGILAAQERTVLGVDPATLASYLIPAISSLAGSSPHNLAPARF